MLYIYTHMYAHLYLYCVSVHPSIYPSIHQAGRQAGRQAGTRARKHARRSFHKVANSSCLCFMLFNCSCYSSGNFSVPVTLLCPAGNWIARSLRDNCINIKLYADACFCTLPRCPVLTVLLGIDPLPHFMPLLSFSQNPQTQKRGWHAQLCYQLGGIQKETSARMLFIRSLTC